MGVGIWISAEVKSIAATVGQPDVRIDPLYNLAVELEHDTQHAMGGGGCGPKLIVKLRSVASFIPALSSPWTGSRAICNRPDRDRHAGIRNLINQCARCRWVEG